MAFLHMFSRGNKIVLRQCVSIQVSDLSGFKLFCFPGKYRFYSMMHLNRRHRHKCVLPASTRESGFLSQIHQFRISKQHWKHVCLGVVLALTETGDSWQAQTPWQLYCLADGWTAPWMYTLLCICSSLNDSFEPLEISNYCTPVPRNRRASPK